MGIILTIIVGSSGLVISDFETMNLLNNCTDLTTLRSSMWGVVLHSGLELDLSKLGSLKIVNISGWDFKVKYPSSLDSFYGDQVLPPVFANNSSLKTVRMIAQTHYLNHLNDESWRNFFKSLEKCVKINSVELLRCDGINDNCFFESTNDDEDMNEIFTGDHIISFILRTNTVGMSYVVKHLRGVTNLTLELGYSLDEGVCDLCFDNLTELVLKGKFLNDFSIFNDLNSLTSLTIDNCENFKTLSGLETLTSSLTKLVVNNTGVSSVVPLKNMVSLTHLDLKNNAIGPNSEYDGKSVSNLDILASLHPDGTREDDLKGKLKTLYLQGNDGLNGVIESHPISRLTWSNGSIW